MMTGNWPKTDRSKLRTSTFTHCAGALGVAGSAVLTIDVPGVPSGPVCGSAGDRARFCVAATAAAGPWRSRPLPWPFSSSSIS
jgi:hypothetical protein